jgi:hypothetical protein
LTVVSAPDEPKTTDREDLVQRYLDKLGISCRRNAIYCFTCKDYFIHNLGSAPNKCYVGNHPFNGRGQYCIPDFLILSPLYKEYEWNEKTGEAEKRKVKDEIWSLESRDKPLKKAEHGRLIAVIMVNEKEHYKNISKMNQVASQVKEFREAGLKVFIMRERELDGFCDLSMIGMIYYISHAIVNSRIYDIYSLGNEFKERSCSYRELAGRTSPAKN